MASPQVPFVFTDVVPLVMGVIVAIAAVSVLAVVWMWALRPSRSPLPARLPEPRDAREGAAFTAAKRRWQRWQ